MSKQNGLCLNVTQNHNRKKRNKMKSKILTMIAYQKDIPNKGINYILIFQIKPKEIKKMMKI